MTKLAILLVILFSTQSYAHVYGQQHNISLRLDRVQLKKVFRAIENQGFFRFVYNDDALPREQLVTINVKEASLDDVLGKVLANTSLNYRKLGDNLVVITRGQEPQPTRQEAAPVPAPVVTGKVANAKGEPLAGVTVQEKGTNNATTTRDDGSFSLEVTNADATLVFTYVGYQQQEAPLNNQTTLSITLAAETTNLNEAVVIGYQTVRRKDLTGATGIVNMNDATKLTTGSVTESLQGLVPGVTIRNAGNPGSSPTVEIRGVGSFSSISPLYVIDGMLADVDATVNPDDVASVQILKDASAAAIYGSRAGNGVIIITTKKGKEGPAKFSVSGKYGLQTLPKKWGVMDAASYLKTVQIEYGNSGINLPTGVAAQVANNTIKTDWQDAITRTGNDQDYNLSISGGSHTSSYLLSGGYYGNQGVLIGNDFQRASLRINTETHKGRLTVGENLLFSNSSGEYPGGGINAFYEAPSMLPIIAVKGPQYTTIPSNPAGWGMGTNDLPTYANNYAAVNALDRVTYNYTKIISNAFAEFKFTDWLSYRFNAGAWASFNYTREVRDTGIWRYNNQPPNTSVSNDRRTFTNFLLEHTLNFNKSFGLHSVSAVVGFSRTQQEDDYTIASRTLLQTIGGQQYTTIGTAVGSSSTDGGTDVLWRQHGYLGRINYGYDDRYLLTLTGRIDQDTRFAPSQRTGYFPSVAAGWRISREKFFHVPWIDELKLRGSWGRLGISSGLDAYSSFPYLSVLNNSPRAIYGSGQTPVVGQYQAALSNPDIRWETRKEENAGFDANLFSNRVTVTADLYNSLSTGVLVALPQPLYQGVVQVTGQQTVTNAASIRNKGVELAVTYRSNRQRDLKWDVSANLTTIDNKVVSVGDQGIDATGSKVDYLEATNFIRAQVGHSMGQWYMIRTAGIFKSQADVTGYTNKNGQIIQPNAKPGDIKYADANGDGVIDNKDRQYSGSPWPTLQTGAQFNASYHGFTLNIQVVGIFGYKIYDDVRRVLDSYQLTNFRKDINPWSTTNPNGNDPRLAVDNPGDPTVSINNMAQTSRWLENGSYVRIRNIELGYQLPRKALRKAGINNARVYLSGQNLLTLTGYKGLDPDVVGNSIIARGFDTGNWPPSRVLSAGLQFDF
ncbi:TonB-dependent receptor [Puia sp.]|uniref:TonB-dependent receptor n=1 Tax=Puia sp. TaxID=2045100 RepID=UPI002F4240FC